MDRESPGRLWETKDEVPDAHAVKEYERRGYGVIQSGKFDDDVHYYLDTEKDFGYVIELGNVGKIRPAERRYPN